MKDLTNEIIKIDCKINNKIIELLKWASNRNCDWNIYDAILKGYEEFGELSEAVLVSTGRIKHKTLSEKSTGEIADNINQLIDFASFKKEFINELDFLVSNQSSFSIHIRHSFEKIKNNDFKEVVINKLLTFKKFKDFLINLDINSLNSDILRFEDCTKYLAEINFLLYLIENNISKEDVNDQTILTSLIELEDRLEAKSNKWKKITETL
jgi:NTP pyrophosphatase (non-canonical NTP hydrolase)